MVPFGLPGLWVMVLALLGYAAFGAFERVGPVTIAATVVLAGVGEALEAWIGFRYARRYGGSSRAGWGAIAGGLVGTAVGTPVPVVGNLVGAFLGAFVGAALAEHSRARDARMSVGGGRDEGRVGAGDRRDRDVRRAAVAT